MYVFLLVATWFLALLWGLVKDTNITSRILRLLAAFFLYRMANRKVVDAGFYDGDGFWLLLEQMSSGFPIWLIVMLSLLLVAVIYGYIKTYKEEQSI